MLRYALYINTKGGGDIDGSFEKEKVHIEFC